VYEVAERRKGLRYWADRAIEMVTGAAAKQHAVAHDNLLAVARKAAEKVQKKKSLVTVAPEVTDDEAESGPPPVPAGRKKLAIVN